LGVSTIITADKSVYDPAKPIAITWAILTAYISVNQSAIIIAITAAIITVNTSWYQSGSPSESFNWLFKISYRMELSNPFDNP